MLENTHKLKAGAIPERTKLYSFDYSRDVLVEERQNDGTCDQVIIRYIIGESEEGLFAKEYRPDNILKDGAKKVDFTAIKMNHKQERLHWYMYDMKASLSGEHTVVTLYGQWSAGLQYLRDNVLCYAPGYSVVPELGVITREYDKERMLYQLEKQKDKVSRMESKKAKPIALLKKNIDIAKEKGILKATEAIVNEKFEYAEGESYSIYIRYFETSEIESVFSYEMLV